MKRIQKLLLPLIALLLVFMSACTDFDQSTAVVSPDAPQIGSEYTQATQNTQLPDEPVHTVSEYTETSEITETEQAEQTEEPAQTTDSSVTSSNTESSFEIHFIDVGQADAALVLCDGKAMLIDGGNVGDSNTLYTYLKKHEISHLDYVVGTHAHEDHIGGIAGALNYATVSTVYSPVGSYDSDAFSNFVKYVEKRNSSITVPQKGDSFNLGSAKVDILAVNTSSDTNNTSIVLKITYGKTTFLFTGDAERDVEQYLLNNNIDLSATVLKVGHHGSETSTSYVFLREVMPEYAVISVGKGNTYGHPHDEVLSRLRDADVKVFRTDLQGDIICTSDGESVEFKVTKSPDADTLKATETTVVEKQENTSAQTDKGTDYILNTNTKKFHYPTCKSADKISEENKKTYTGSRENLISEGYSPCGNCKP